MNTALLMTSLADDETVIRTLLTNALDLARKQQYEQAEKMFKEGLSYDKWREGEYGARMRLGMAYCWVKQG